MGERGFGDDEKRKVLAQIWRSQGAARERDFGKNFGRFAAQYLPGFLGVLGISGFLIFGGGGSVYGVWCPRLYRSIVWGIVGVTGGPRPGSYGIAHFLSVQRDNLWYRYFTDKGVKGVAVTWYMKGTVRCTLWLTLPPSKKG
ncbi:uncharacterized protein PGTG_10851 [Puccinia graminis f. sp. tritici CRL 75-36-700-3]|uniref:Transmembrane protein n=1 Tax=Puccinia graminis f. sp. tritici (strain CRL 75-36-700-3 / race SCCL) TaxID=418459 RepID=E3KK67_PUCGT|nr:uncharacterized protein PGTG_10851 [Puccinia graminis f. sp. tritici CRL 75-36-700-3]EFP84692.1 hypothetical protein PGTG_10851 [Puccinia graminis f. sp. tritici CRL 75-36-700-3]